MAVGGRLGKAEVSYTHSWCYIVMFPETWTQIDALKLGMSAVLLKRVTYVVSMEQRYARLERLEKRPGWRCARHEVAKCEQVEDVRAVSSGQRVGRCLREIEEEEVEESLVR